MFEGPCVPQLSENQRNVKHNLLNRQMHSSTLQQHENSKQSMRDSKNSMQVTLPIFRTKELYLQSWKSK